MFGRLPWVLVALLSAATPVFAQDDPTAPPPDPIPDLGPPPPPPAAPVKEADAVPSLPPGRAFAWLTAGSAVAAATLGGVFMVNQQARERDLERFAATPAVDARALERSRDRFHLLSLVAFGTAGALAATSAVMFAISPAGVQLKTEF